MEDLAGAFRLISGASVLGEVIQGTVEARSEDVDGALLQELGRAASFPDAPGFVLTSFLIWRCRARGQQYSEKRRQLCDVCRGVEDEMGEFVQRDRQLRRMIGEVVGERMAASLEPREDPVSN